MANAVTTGRVFETIEGTTREAYVFTLHKEGERTLAHSSFHWDHTDTVSHRRAGEEFRLCGRGAQRRYRGDTELPRDDGGQEDVR